MMSSICCSLVYNALSIDLVASVPANAKGLAGKSISLAYVHPRLIQTSRLLGGLISTAFQLGSALGLAICSIPQHAVLAHFQKKKSFNDKEAQLKSFAAGLWTAMALAAVALMIALVGMKWGFRPNQSETSNGQASEAVNKEEGKV